jgi:hypothetical protein
MTVQADGRIADDPPNAWVAWQIARLLGVAGQRTAFIRALLDGRPDEARETAGRS